MTGWSSYLHYYLDLQELSFYKYLNSILYVLTTLNIFSLLWAQKKKHLEKF